MKNITEDKSRIKALILDLQGRLVSTNTLDGKSSFPAQIMNEYNHGTNGRKIAELQKQIIIN